MGVVHIFHTAQPTCYSARTAPLCKTPPMFGALEDSGKTISLHLQNQAIIEELKDTHCLHIS